MTSILGILRDRKYSPHSNDLSIMQAVAEVLQRAGRTVRLTEESDIQDGDAHVSAVFSMARSRQALQRLMQWQQKHGTTVINPSQGVMNCGRMEAYEILSQQGIPIAPYTEIPTQGQLPKGLSYPCWLKRADASSQEQDDVAFVEDAIQLEQHVQQMQARGIGRMVACKHVAGDLIKFYGVAGTPFFHWYYPTADSQGHSKFGWERHNGKIHRFSFDTEALHGMADRAARATQCPVYGGDCIADGNGVLHIIDFNDWPSFRPCIEPAAQAIASLILHKTEKTWTS